MLIVHQLSDALDAKLRANLPAGVTLKQMPAETPWALPPETEGLIVGLGVMRKLPDGGKARPADWPPRLRWVHLLSTGVDMLPEWLFDVEELTVSRGAQSVAIAEYVLTMMLAFEKEVPEIWVTSPEAWEKRPLGGLAGKTLGIVGLGNIGRQVAKRALAFDMTVVASRRKDAPSGMEGVALAPLETLLSTSDHLLLCAPLTDATRGILGPKAFAAMKKGMHLLNISRGEMIDEASLIAALDDGTLARASLDVWSPEPPQKGSIAYSHPRIRLSSHVSFSSRTTSATTEAIMLRNLALWAAGDVAAMHGKVDRAEKY